MSIIKSKNECDVCYNTELRFIKCLKCDYMACIKCYQRYAIDNINLPSCMKCKYTWSYTEVLTIFPRKFVTEFNKIREEVLFNLNMSLLPVYANKYLERYKIFTELLSIRVLSTRVYNNLNKETNLNIYEVYHTNDVIEKIRINFMKLGYIYDGPITSYNFSTSLKLMRTYCLSNRDYFGGNKKFSEYYWEIMAHLRETSSSKFKIPDIEQIENKIPLNKKCKKCNGYLNFSGECTSCGTAFCTECEEICNSEHTCDPDTIKTIKLLRKDSVECPNCEVYIYKIEGCNQMWCTNCNVPFDWKTRKILDIKNFHNPHYIDYIRSGHQVQPLCVDNDDDLGRFINWETDEIRLGLRELNINLNNMIPDVDSDIIRCSLKYLNNEIDIINYKKKLQKLDKNKNLYQEIRDINDIFRLQTNEAYMTYCNNEPKLITILNDIIRENNKYRDELSSKYSRIVGFIDLIRPRKMKCIKYYVYDQVNTQVHIASHICGGCKSKFKKYSLFAEHLKRIGIVKEDREGYSIIECPTENEHLQDAKDKDKRIYAV